MVCAMMAANYSWDVDAIREPVDRRGSPTHRGDGPRRRAMVTRCAAVVEPMLAVEQQEPDRALGAARRAHDHG